MLKLIILALLCVAAWLVFRKLWHVLRPVREPLQDAQDKGLRVLGMTKIADVTSSWNEKLDRTVGKS